jgi:hypothetical protein
MIAFIVVLIVAHEFDPAGTAGWAITFAVALVISAAEFWGKHSRRWFWPAIVFLIIVHGVLLARWQSSVVRLPDAGTIKGALFFDGALDCLLLFWMHWLFDPRDKPRTASGKTVEVVVYGFAIVLIAIVGLIWWGVDKNEREINANSRMIYARTSMLSMAALKACFDDRPKAQDAWEVLPAPQPKERLMDGLYHAGVIITDQGDRRRIEITTLQGKPLHDRDKRNYSRCLNDLP